MTEQDQGSLFDVADREIETAPMVGPGAPFERFWAVYPRKVAKGAAKKAWEKATKGMGADEVRAFTTEVVNAIKAQRKWRDANRSNPDAHIPDWKHPSTWLNGMCWLDELDSVSASRGRGPVELPQCSESGCTDTAAGTFTRLCAYHFSEQNKSRYGNCTDFQMLRDRYAADGLSRRRDESREEWLGRLRHIALTKIRSIGNG